MPKEIGVAKDGFCILTTCINRKFNKIPYVPHVRVRPEGAGLFWVKSTIKLNYIYLNP